MARVKKQSLNPSGSAALEATPDRSGRTKMRTRVKLLAAAQRVMARTGVDKATIAEIANEADVGFGSFYNHFSSKEEIAGAVFEAQSEKLASLIDIVRAQTADPALAVSYVQRLFIRKAHADPVWGWFIVRTQGALPQMQKTFGERAVLTLKRGATEKRFELKALDTAIAITLGSLVSVIKSILEGGLTASAEEEFVELMLRMYGVNLEEARALSRRPLPPELLAALAEE